MKNMKKKNVEEIIDAFLDQVEKDGKQGKDLTVYYVIRVLRKILKDMCKL